MVATLLQLVGLLAVAAGLAWLLFPAGVLIGAGLVAFVLGVAMEGGD